MSYYITPSKVRDVILFMGKLLEEVCDCILAMAPLNANQGSDRLAWNLSADGYFTVNSVYEGLCLEKIE